MEYNTLYIVPSRGRPHNVQRLLQAWKETCAHPGTDTQILIVNDDDDTELPAYKEVVGKFPWAQHEVTPRIRLGPTLNLYAHINYHLYDGIGFMGDDHVPRTQYWDETLAELLCNNHPAVTYGNDLLQGATIPTMVLLSSPIIKALGYMVPPGFVHLYIDNVWKLWGETLGRLIYVPHVIIEHMHPAAGKAASDARYDEVNSPQSDAFDRTAYNNYIAHFGDRDFPILKAIAWPSQ